MLGFVFASRLVGQKEILDDFSFSGLELEQNLEELSWFNRLLGGENIVSSALDKIGDYKGEECIIVDIGTGGGEILAKLTKQTRAKIIGWEANPNIVRLARERLNNYSQINIVEGNVFSKEFLSQKQDILIASLFFHHFTDKEIIKFLSLIKINTGKAIIINDLHRSMLAYNLFRFVTFITNASHTTKHDGKISILKGFTKNDWHEILKKAGVKNYSIKWKWAFRHQIIVHCNE